MSAGVTILVSALSGNASGAVVTAVVTSMIQRRAERRAQSAEQLNQLVRLVEQHSQTLTRIMTALDIERRTKT